MARRLVIGLYPLSVASPSPSRPLVYSRVALFCAVGSASLSLCLSLSAVFLFSFYNTPTPLSPPVPHLVCALFSLSDSSFLHSRHHPLTPAPCPCPCRLHLSLSILSRPPGLLLSLPLTLSLPLSPSLVCVAIPPLSCFATHTSLSQPFPPLRYPPSCRSLSLSLPCVCVTLLPPLPSVSPPPDQTPFPSLIGLYTIRRAVHSTPYATDAVTQKHTPLTAPPSPSLVFQFPHPLYPSTLVSAVILASCRPALDLILRLSLRIRAPSILTYKRSIFRYLSNNQLELAIHRCKHRTAKWTECE